MDKLEQLRAYIQSSPNHFGRYIEKSRPDLFSLIKDQHGETNAEKSFNALNPDVRDKHLTCHNPNCSNPTDSFISVTKGYRRFCSNKCSASDPTMKAAMTKGLRSEESKQKRKQSLIEKHGTDSMIGYGTYKRAGSHLGEARKSAASNHKLNTIRSIWSAGSKPIIVKLKDVSSKTEGLDLETNLVEAIGTVATIPGIKRGPLTNQVPGGNGGAHSDETNQKLRKLRKGKVWITDGEFQKYVPESEVSEWESKGWKRGVRPSSKRDAYFENGSRTKNTIWINKDGNNKRVFDPTEYLKDGWVIGQLSTNPGQHKKAYIWITNGIESKNIKSTDPIPDGWTHGRVRSKFPGGYKKKA